MKMKKCHSCGEEVDNSLAKCPYCGNTAPGGSFWGFMKFTMGIYVVVLVVAIILSKLL